MRKLVNFCEGKHILESAEKIARESHHGQIRKDGSPYITHVELVVSQLRGNQEAQVVGWLHDVLEDTDLTESDLLDFGLSKQIVDIVLLLTKRREQKYEDYIDQVKKNEIARKVKIADILANLMDNPGKKQIIKFSKALLRLCG